MTDTSFDDDDDDNVTNKKGQLSLTNPRNACETFARFICKSSGVVRCIASLPIDSLPMVSYLISVLYSKCVCKMRRFGDTRLLKLP